MKKTLIALAAVAVAGAASAQVTLGGSVAFGVQNKAADKVARMNMTDADLKFSAKEDLGGGLMATASISTEHENMRSGNVTVGSAGLTLSGGFGTLAYATFLSGQSKLSAGVSAEDDMSDLLGGYTGIDYVGYTLPQFAKGLSITLEAGAALPKLAGQSSTGATTAAVGSLADGQLKLSDSANWDLAVAYTAGPLWVYYEYNETYNDFRASYDLGVVKVAARTRIFDDKSSSRNEITAVAPMGATTLGLHYVKQGTTSGTGVSMTYAMSKNSSVIASYVTGSNWLGGTGKNAATGNNYRVQFKQAF